MLLSSSSPLCVTSNKLLNFVQVKHRKARHDGCRADSLTLLLSSGKKKPYGVTERLHVSVCASVLGGAEVGLSSIGVFHIQALLFHHFPYHPRPDISYIFINPPPSPSLFHSLFWPLLNGGMWGMQQWMGEWGRQHANDWRLQVFLFFFLWAHWKFLLLSSSGLLKMKEEKANNEIVQDNVCTSTSSGECMCVPALQSKSRAH